MRFLDKGCALKRRDALTMRSLARSPTGDCDPWVQDEQRFLQLPSIELAILEEKVHIQYVGYKSKCYQSFSTFRDRQIMSCHLKTSDTFESANALAFITYDLSASLHCCQRQKLWVFLGSQTGLTVG